MEKFNIQGIQKLVEHKCQAYFGLTFENVSETQLYRAICLSVRDLLTDKRIAFKEKKFQQKTKQVYYMSMEFLLGRSLKNHLFNLGLTDVFEEICKKRNTTLDDIYAIEPDAGLG
ncbi:MAG: alpha-glucan phosphorylase, partial [Clostridia bacterium]